LDVGGEQTKSTPLDPFSRRLLRLAGLLAVLVILVALNAVLRGGEENPFNPNPVAAAAERTQAETGGRMSMTASYRLPTGQSMTMDGDGAYDNRAQRAQRAQFSMELQAPAPVGSMTMEVVASDERAYLRSSMLTSQLPAGKEWISVDPESGDLDEGSLPGSTDPREQLEMLEAISGRIETLGQESIRGAITTHYRGTIDLASYAELAREGGADEAADLFEELGGAAEAEAWIDRAGRLRQMRMILSLAPSPGSAPMTMDMTIELYDFGATPAIALPSPAAVIDAGEWADAAAAGLPI
jgi:hypothetical protein